MCLTNVLWACAVIQRSIDEHGNETISGLLMNKKKGSGRNKNKTVVTKG
jgi:hypothetical protein